MSLMNPVETQKPDLSIVIPCYNSTASLKQELPAFIAFLNKANLVFELILVDDGSKDNQQMQDVALRYSCQLYLLPTNQGKGAALKLGFSKATGAVQIFTDSDFPFSPEAIIAVNGLLSSGQADLVIGDRTHPSSNYYLEISRLRKVGSLLISGISKKYLKTEITDIQCGLKGFTAAAAAAIFPQTIAHRFAIDFEVLYLASRMKYRIRKIPVQLVTFYPSSIKVVRDGFKIILEILKVVGVHGKTAGR